LKIAVKEIRRSYFMLLIEIAGICGGVYATSGKLISIELFSIVIVNV